MVDKFNQLNSLAEPESVDMNVIVADGIDRSAISHVLEMNIIFRFPAFGLHG